MTAPTVDDVLREARRLATTDVERGLVERLEDKFGRPDPDAVVVLNILRAQGIGQAAETCYCGCEHNEFCPGCEFCA